MYKTKRVNKIPYRVELAINHNIPNCMQKVTWLSYV